MLSLRYSTGLWICFDFRVVNILLFWICQGYTRFSIKYFMIAVWQYCEYALDSEYARVLNMLGLYMVPNKILHNIYLPGFWMCLEFWTCQCYLGFCRKRPIIHVWQSFDYSSGSQYARAWVCMGCKYAKVTLGFVFKLYFKDSRYLECLEFWIC